MPLFRSGPSIKELKQQNAALEADAKQLNSEIREEEKLYRNREAELQKSEERVRENELRAQRADAARQEARSALAEAEHVLAIRKGEEEAQTADGHWAPHLMAASARAKHITEENAFLEHELHESKHHTEECQESLRARAAELDEGALRARSIHGALSTEINRARTRLAALQLEGNQLEANHAEQMQQRDKLVRQTEEAERLLEMERHEGERLAAELLRLREEVQNMWADYWESLPYIDVGTDLVELQKLQALELKSRDRAAMIERQLRAERERRQAIMVQGRVKCDELQKRLMRLRQTNGALKPGCGRAMIDGPSAVESAVTPRSRGVPCDTATRLDLASTQTPAQNVDLDCLGHISSVEGSSWEGSCNGRDWGHSHFPFQTPLQDHSFLSPVSEYARGPNGSLLSPGMHYF